VRAVEIRPLNPQRTHHARLGIDSNNESKRRDAADDEVGFEGMAWGEDPPGQLITWTPGMSADAGMAGAAWRLTGDAALVLHTHVRPSGKPERIGFRLGFYFAQAAPTVYPVILRIGSRDVDIPPGEPRHEISGSYELPIDVDAHSIFPHAHSLCRAIEVQAELPQGATTTLIAIRRFDENWHDTYRFLSPLRLPRGTRLMTRFTYDNTTANVRNPNDPPRRVVYGSNADDEMADVYLQVTPADPQQAPVLAEHYQQAELGSKIAGYQKTLEMFADDPWSIEALASSYVAAGQPEEAVRLLEGRPELLRQSVQANVVLGMAQLARGDAAAAEQELRRALAMDERLALAWLGMGQALAVRSQFEPAEKAFRSAIQFAPRLLVARLDLADLLIRRERLEEAAAVCSAAIELEDAEYKPHLKLANILAQQKRYDESLTHFTAAQKRAPFLYSPQSSLAIACYQLGDEQTARRLLQEALAEAPHDPVPHCFLGQIARRDEQWDEARQHLQRASELPTPSTWPASHRRQFLTLVYKEQLQLAEQLHDEALAREVATEWLDLDPTNDQVRNLLHQIERSP
jgi:tetratricopeptide (TPR) repeat protein